MAGDETGNKPDAKATEEVSADDVRRIFGDYLSRVGFGNERIIIVRHGKPVAALIPMKDFETLQPATTTVAA